MDRKDTTKFRGNPFDMLREAFNNRQDIPINEDIDAKAERLARKANVIAAHEQLIDEHAKKGLIFKHVEKMDDAMAHRCGVSTCYKRGTLTQGTKGSDQWYCSEHYMRG